MAVIKIPVSVDELNRYENYEAEEIVISKFLETQQGKAFNWIEIYADLKKPIPYIRNENDSLWTWQNVGSFILNVFGQSNLQSKLKQMAESGKIKMKVIKREEYYFFE